MFVSFNHKELTKNFCPRDSSGVYLHMKHLLAQVKSSWEQFFRVDPFFLRVSGSMNINVKASVVPPLLESSAMFWLDSDYCKCKVLTKDILTPPVLKWHM